MAGGWALQHVRWHAKAGEESVPGLCRTGEHAEGQESGRGLVSVRAVQGKRSAVVPRVSLARAGRTAAAAGRHDNFASRHRV